MCISRKWWVAQALACLVWTILFAALPTPYYAAVIVLALAYSLPVGTAGVWAGYDIVLPARLLFTQTIACLVLAACFIVGLLAMVSYGSNSMPNLLIFWRPAVLLASLVLTATTLVAWANLHQTTASPPLPCNKGDSNKHP